jgi:hypothetical protein
MSLTVALSLTGDGHAYEWLKSGIRGDDPSEKFVVRAIGHILMKQAFVRIRVSIMLPTASSSTKQSKSPTL